MTNMSSVCLLFYSIREGLHITKDLTWTTPVDSDSKGKKTPVSSQTAKEEGLTESPASLLLCSSAEHPDREVNRLV